MLMLFSAILPLSAQAEMSVEQKLEALQKLRPDQQNYKRVPEVEFLKRDGSRTSIADFKGKIVLLNFWAGWCAPCVEEMPELDKLQLEEGRNGLEVVPVSQDFKGVDAAIAFYNRNRLQNLKVYADDRNRLFNAIGGEALPTTLLIDKKGNIRLRVEGYFDWTKPEITKLIKVLLEE